jgi:hypothetical protein
MRKSLNRVILPLFALFMLTAWSAAAKPDFSGDWKLNAAKSDFGQLPAPESMTEKITHEDPKLKVATKVVGSRGEFNLEVNYTTDGKECLNKMRGTPLTSTLKWEGDTLVVGSKTTMGDNDIAILERWTLSDAGKTLSILVRITSDRGEMTQKMVLEKQ